MPLDEDMITFRRQIAALSQDVAALKGQGPAASEDASAREKLVADLTATRERVEALEATLNRLAADFAPKAPGG